MSSFATVCINNNLTTCQNRYLHEATDHKLTGRIHMIDNNIIIEQSLNMSRIAIYCAIAGLVTIACYVTLNKNGFYSRRSIIFQ